ncbi:hypothetical protein RCF98_12815 [Thiothrix lacustris]|uniref:DUF1772 domain-containing protein n=1 Tax=Thiothrix lacustris TaxID=525917 RepID=A0ABY9MNT1_9GAMM|nr:anthrone oxygenase family protein [Thiothrix lacustris]WML89850.1 hypothetical protein RCF98_12815 [Thiothrix lacustris]
MNAKFLIVPQLLATLLLGILCGVFAAFTLDVTPALQQVDATTYTHVQQHLNQTPRNLGFAVLFFGATLFPFVSAGMAAWQSQRRVALYWLIIALVHFIGVYWVSIVINIPLHQETMGWNPAAPPTDWQSSRESWANGNLIRTLTEGVCFVGALTLVVLRGWLAAQPVYVMRRQH